MSVAHNIPIQHQRLPTSISVVQRISSKILEDWVCVSYAFIPPVLRGQGEVKEKKMQQVVRSDGMEVREEKWKKGK